MAVQLPIPVRFADVFPAGAYVLAVEPINDSEKVTAKAADPQQRDKESGERLWAVRVLDADSEARKGQAEVVVKIAAPQQPVPPDVMPGTPFRPAEFGGLLLMPYLDTNRAKPRIAFRLRARSMRAPSAKPVKTTASAA
jgi:hypothetical protein